MCRPVASLCPACSGLGEAGQRAAPGPGRGGETKESERAGGTSARRGQEGSATGLDTANAASGDTGISLCN